MHVRYRSLGAAQSVTGSRHLIEIDQFNVLLDCGLFQGFKELRLRNWEAFPMDPDAIDAVVLSHAHIDHSGYLPKLVKEGFKGPIYCTHATESLLKIMLIDSAKLQEEEAEWAHKKGYSKHERPLPLYTEKDAEQVFPLIHSIPYNQSVALNDAVRLEFKNAGHILGASIVELTLKGESQEKKITYSGDLGREDDPLLYPPENIEFTDILLVESTYGNRKNRVIDAQEDIARIVNETYDKGCLLIPAFSVGRTQNMLFYLKNLMQDKRIPEMPIYVDSPMAINVTELYKSYSSIQKLREDELIDNKSVFDYKNIHYIRNQIDSAQLNNVKKRAIIISASGMCTGGRILHHLFHRIPEEGNTVMLVGYQAEGTRGSDLEKGTEFLKIFGLSVPVKCRVEVLAGLSAHADLDELKNWLSHFKEHPKMTFTVHGETEAAHHLGGVIKGSFGGNVFVPKYMESFELFNGI